VSSGWNPSVRSAGGGNAETCHRQTNWFLTMLPRQRKRSLTSRRFSASKLQINQVEIARSRRVQLLRGEVNKIPPVSESPPLPSEGPDRTAEAIRRALPALTKLDRYEQANFYETLQWYAEFNRSRRQLWSVDLSEGTKQWQWRHLQVRCGRRPASSSLKGAGPARACDFENRTAHDGSRADVACLGPTFFSCKGKRGRTAGVHRQNGTGGGRAIDFSRSASVAFE
jgi:hypothetical protein